MSLTIYLTRDDIPGYINYIQGNDAFFDALNAIQDNNVNRLILKSIDYAEYNDDLTFKDRTPSKSIQPKQFLSSGTKTLLNIINFNDDYCFSLCECGNNALCMLPHLTAGFALWSDNFCAFDTNKYQDACDIVCNDKHFNSFIEFLSYIEDNPIK